MGERRSGYKAFLLRLWRVDNGGQPVWRIMLQEAGTQEQHVFSSISALQKFLADLIKERERDETRAAPAGTGSDLPGA